LHLDARVARRSGFDMDPWSTQSEVINNALNNCHRAFADLDALLQPAVVNIQALIMLVRNRILYARKKSPVNCYRL
jgi:hypothetical protein